MIWLRRGKLFSLPYSQSFSNTVPRSISLSIDALFSASSIHKHTLLFPVPSTCSFFFFIARKFNGCRLIISKKGKQLTQQLFAQTKNILRKNNIKAQVFLVLFLLKHLFINFIANRFTFNGGRQFDGNRP